MLLGGLQKLTLIDYPGEMAATVFTIGCNFLCGFCHNSELVDAEKIKVQPRIKEEDFFKFLKGRVGILEGVCITGGEPTLQPDLADFLLKIKNLGFDTKLDTNGTRPEVIEELLKKDVLDYIAMDIKAPLTQEKYEKITGVKIDIEKIKQSVEIIKKSGLRYEFRTTVLPTLHSKENIIEIAKALAPANYYFLQQFRQGKTLSPAFEKEKSYSKKELEEIQQAVSEYFVKCIIRE